VKSANHYRDAMGFPYERFWGEPPSFVILYRDGMYLMLKEVLSMPNSSAAGRRSTTGLAINLTVAASSARKTSTATTSASVRS
jgi:hypothetical protein